MRLLTLEIHNVRGIRHLVLKPKGNSIVIWGPNGSGKSAVVDAVDFLLTGRMSRLMGAGTGDISLKEHGPHIDCRENPEISKVRAIVRVPGIDADIQIERCLAHPGTLECDTAIQGQLKPVLDLARRGQHVLTRREILKYVTSEAGTRAREIQALLNVSDIETIRRNLVKVQNTAEGYVKSAEQGVRTEQGRVSATIGAEGFRDEEVLHAINENRAILGGSPIVELDPSLLKKGLVQFTAISEEKAVNISMLQQDISNLMNAVSDVAQEKIARLDEQLRSTIEAIHADTALRRALFSYKLTQLGLEIIDKTEGKDCPLCDTEWPAGELRQYLEQKLLRGQEAAEHQRTIAALSGEIANTVAIADASLNKVIAVGTVMALDDEVALLQAWRHDLETLLAALNNPNERYLSLQWDVGQTQRLLAPDELPRCLENIEAEVRSKYPEATPEQTAWDTLTRLEENLRDLVSARDRFARASLTNQRATILLQSFLDARDAILGDLYHTVEARFVDLYQKLHGPDEGGFSASIRPAEAALHLEVDFYGRGKHPPHALHSEGHQDSMGLCLYLALAEHLTEGLIDLVILDDVVMSVDANHRKQVCQLLASEFRDKQFLITTHDKTWANQLRGEGIVDKDGSIEFYNWHIDTGPFVSVQEDMWDQIREDMLRNDIPSAAARLRRGSEEFFAAVCDALHAEVRFRLNGRWELGDYLPAAIGQYNSLLRKAKNAAQSWGNTEVLDMLQEVQTTVSQVFSRTGTEQWAVNANVHYNNWANFTSEDFQSVVDVFQDLFAVFLCSKCGMMLSASTFGNELANVRCPCGDVNLNLVRKRESH